MMEILMEYLGELAQAVKRDGWWLIPASLAVTWWKIYGVHVAASFLVGQ